MPNEDEDLPGPEPRKGKGKAKKPEAVSPPPPPPEPKAPEVKKERHTSRLMQLALAHGFTQEDIDSTPSAQLWEEIDRMDAMAARRKPVETPKQPETPSNDEDEEYLAELDKMEGLDPKHTAFLRRQHARTKAAEEKAKKVEELEKRDAERTKRAVWDALEAGFAKLAENPGFKALIGEGYASELKDNPGAIGWRNAIASQCGAEETDSPATITRKIVAYGTRLMAGKAPAVPASPPPPPEKAPHHSTRQPREDGRFTVEDYTEASLPAAGDRKVDREAMSGAAVIHEYLREKGDARGELPFVDSDDDSDLPE